MALWNIDLTTEDGALSAAQIGGFACLVAAGLGMISTALLLGVMVGTAVSVATLSVAAFASAEIVLLIVAGFRLRAGKGVAWGLAVAIALALELVVKVAAFAIIGIMINAILLIAVITGIRGALALRRITLTPEDAAEIFS
jgi:hypothetical protein